MLPPSYSTLPERRASEGAREKSELETLKSRVAAGVTLTISTSTRVQRTSFNVRVQQERLYAQHNLQYLIATSLARAGAIINVDSMLRLILFQLFTPKHKTRRIISSFGLNQLQSIVFEIQIRQRGEDSGESLVKIASPPWT
jgi:hypothetical protein